MIHLKIASKLWAISQVKFLGGLEKIRDFLQPLSEKYLLYCQILQSCSNTGSPSSQNKRLFMYSTI